MTRAIDRRRRYRDDPNYRLRRINEARKARGEELARSLEEVALSLSVHARRRERDPMGRFV